jgi:hypothetical protein
MKKLIPFAHPISLTFGLALGAVALLLGAPTVFPLLAQAETGTQFVLGMVVYCAGAELRGGVAYLLTLTLLVLMARGRTCVAFTSVAECQGFRSWLCSSWSFFSAGGQQAGLRVLGIEVALQGQL